MSVAQVDAYALSSHEEGFGLQLPAEGAVFRFFVGLGVALGDYFLDKDALSLADAARVEGTVVCFPGWTLD